MAATQTRSDQIRLISEPVDRDAWLAGQIDEVEVRAFDELETLSRRLNQILAGIVGLLLTTLSTLITLVLSGALSGSGA